MKVRLPINNKMTGQVRQEVAKEYEEMKLKLWKEYEHDRDGYTNAKSEFVVKCTQDAKRLYWERY